LVADLSITLRRGLNPQASGSSTSDLLRERLLERVHSKKRQDIVAR
jgi:hypothetical protein